MGKTLCRWYPTIATLPSVNFLIVGGCLVTSGGYASDLQNPTWQIYGTTNQTLSYNSPFPTTILTDQVPYSLYPLMWVLPETASLLVRMLTCGRVHPLLQSRCLSGISARHICRSRG